MFAADVSEWILCFHLLDADYTLFNQLLKKTVPQSHVFNLRAVDPVAGDMQSRGAEVHW